MHPYVKDSIQIIKGKFSFEAGEWVFSDRVDVTDQHKITISEDGRSFVIDLGDITDQDQYRIAYNVRLNYEPVDGEVLRNEATLKGKGIETKICNERCSSSKSLVVLVLVMFTQSISIK